MTQPAPPAPPAGQGQALALAAASALAGAATVAGAAAILAPSLAAYRIRRRVAEDALGIVMGMPPDAEGFHGPAGAQVARLNLARRAMFLVASIFRLNGDDSLIRAGASRGLWQDSLDRERRFYGQQLVAGWWRTRAGAQVDSASMMFGRRLGWYAVRDSRTSPECRAAHGRNFYADAMPRIGFPGMVHPRCRCLPGTPFPGAALVGAARVASRDGRSSGITGYGRSVPDHRPHQVPARAGVGG